MRKLFLRVYDNADLMSFYNPITFGGTPAFLGGTTINEGDVILGDTIVNEGDITTTDITVTGIPEFLIQTINGNTSIRMGEEAGNLLQGNASIAIGSYAGANTQSTLSIAIGHYAGNYLQGSQSVAMGSFAAQTSQGTDAVSVGFEAGQTNQGNFAVSVGSSAGRTSQGSNAISFGRSAGSSNQGSNAVSLGVNAGKTSQGSAAVAVGAEAGQTSQGIRAVAIGDSAGITSQGSNAVAVGHESGCNAQRPGAVAIGRLAGGTSQGLNAIAIGSSAGVTNQAANCIVINATGVALNNTTTSSCKIAPIRDYASAARRILLYDASTNEAGTNSTNFVIDASNRVGIGIATPLYTLDVNGTARIAQNLYFNNQTQNNMITLFGTTGLADTGQYGFGINSSTLRYNVPSTAAHRWYHNTTNTMTLGSTGLLTTTGGFSGSGASLTSLPAAQITGSLSTNTEFLNNAWYRSAENQNRLYFALSSHTYFASPASIIFRPGGSGSDIVTISEPATNVGRVTAGEFYGSGVGLTALNASQLTSGTVPDARIPSLDASKINAGTFGAGNYALSGTFSATTFSGSGASLTALNASQLTSGTVPDARISGAYTDITSINMSGELRSGSNIRAGLANGVYTPGVETSFTAYAGSAAEYTLISGRSVADTNSTILAIVDGVTRFTARANGDLIISGQGSKPGGGSWAASSDRKIKTDIETANLELCAEIVRSLPLQRFRYIDDIMPPSMIKDRKQLGWIAQDVEVHFPKSVVREDVFGVEDLALLDVDQLHKCAYGAVGYALEKIKNLEAEIEARKSFEAIMLARLEALERSQPL